MKTLRNFTAAALLACGVLTSAQAADYADVIVVVDESGSMSGEHNWIGSMITQLDSELMAAGVGSGPNVNRYALVGFGGGSGINGGRTLANFGSTAAFATAAGNLVTSGSVEDGYAGIDWGFTNLSARAGAALNVILITDEDRDTFNASLTYASTLNAFTGRNALLNAVVNNPFSAPGFPSGLGMDSSGNAYFADGMGGYTTSAGGIVGVGFGTTGSDYVDLAFANGGAAWDLNLLRAGGLTAQSFTEAFVDIKVQEIIVQNPLGAVPEPSTYGLIGAVTLLGAVAWRRRQAKRA
jgi:hypothetical protein